MKITGIGIIRHGGTCDVHTDCGIYTLLCYPTGAPQEPDPHVYKQIDSDKLEPIETPELTEVLRALVRHMAYTTMIRLRVSLLKDEIDTFLKETE